MCKFGSLLTAIAEYKGCTSRKIFKNYVPVFYLYPCQIINCIFFVCDGHFLANCCLSHSWNILVMSQKFGRLLKASKALKAMSYTCRMCLISWCLPVWSIVACMIWRHQNSNLLKLQTLYIWICAPSKPHSNAPSPKKIGPKLTEIWAKYWYTWLWWWIKMLICTLIFCK